MKQTNSLLAIKYLSKEQKRNKVPNIYRYNGKSNPFTTYRNSPISIESKLSITQVPFSGRSHTSVRAAEVKHVLALWRK